MESPSPRPRGTTPAFEAESEAYSLFRSGVSFLETRHPAQAAMLLARALRLEPGRNSIREALGRAEFALLHYDRAAELFAAALRDAPDNDYAQYALARCLSELGRTEEARGHLRLARALRPASDLYRRPLQGTD
jgi:tetratricopeptide (TPR) repeat protein